MTPEIFVDTLIKNQIDWISITDHNSCRNIFNYKNILESHGIKVMPGIEVETSEGIHILVYFEKIEDSLEFGKIIEDSLIIKNFDPEKLGYQICVDEDGEFSELLENPYLGSSSFYSIDEIYNLAKKYNTIIVPAHIFRINGLIKNLGFPPELTFDAVEIKSLEELERASKLGYNSFFYGIDSHFPEQLEFPSFIIEAKSRNFKELKNSIHEKKVILKWQH
jgi:hypothetical protein